MIFRKRKLIDKAGGCVVSKNILQGKGQLKWCFREHPMNAVDNGWRFLSDIDTEDYINDPSNMAICDFNTVAEIEPAILLLYDRPIGTDMELVIEDGQKWFEDA